MTRKRSRSSTWLAMPLTQPCRMAIPWYSHAVKARSVNHPSEKSQRAWGARLEEASMDLAEAFAITALQPLIGHHVGTHRNGAGAAHALAGKRGFFGPPADTGFTQPVDLITGSQQAQARLHHTDMCLTTTQHHLTPPALSQGGRKVFFGMGIEVDLLP